MTVRLPPMEMQAMNDAQRKAAEALIAGPRKAVVGPFIALIRSPELLDRMQRVGEYLRFHNAIPQKLVELAILVTARRVDNAGSSLCHADSLGLRSASCVRYRTYRRPRGLRGLSAAYRRRRNPSMCDNRQTPGKRTV